MAHQSGLIINHTIKVDGGVLPLAKHRALLERTSVNRFRADALEDYADRTMDVARRTNKACVRVGVVSGESPAAPPGLCRSVIRGLRPRPVP